MTTKRLWVYSGMYAVVAFIILVYSLSQVKAIDLPDLASFLLIGLILASWQVELNKAIMPLSESITAAAQLILPTPLVVIIDACIGFSVTMRRRRQAINIVFNLANHIVPAFIAGTIYTRMGYRWQLLTWDGLIVAALVLAVRYFFALFTASVFVAWRDHKSAFEVFRTIVRADGWNAPTARVLALLIMLAYPQARTVALVLAAFLLLCMRQSAQLYAHRELLTHSARYDGLTEVGNRHAWKQLLAELDQRPQSPYLIALFDLNGMKTVNDCYGHEMGDQVLRSFAFRLTEAVGVNRVFRFGGDEFVVLLTRKGPGDLPSVQQQLQNVINNFTHEWAARDIHVSASIGLTFTNDTSSLAEALRAADHAMYEDKRRSTQDNQQRSVIS